MSNIPATAPNSMPEIGTRFVAWAKDGYNAGRLIAEAVNDPEFQRLLDLALSAEDPRAGGAR